MRALQTEFDSAGDRPVRKQVLNSVAFQIQKATLPARDNAELVNLRAVLRFVEEGHGTLLQRVLTERSAVAVQDRGPLPTAAPQIMLSKESVRTAALEALQGELDAASDDMLQACSTVTAAAGAWDSSVRSTRKHVSGCVAQAVVRSLSRNFSAGGSVPPLLTTVKSMHDLQGRLAEWLRRAEKASEEGLPCMDRMSWKQSMASAGGGTTALRQCCGEFARELLQCLPHWQIGGESPSLLQRGLSIATIDKDSNSAARAMSAAATDAQADAGAMLHTAQQLEQESVFLQMRSATLDSQLEQAGAELAAAEERNRLLQQHIDRGKASLNGLADEHLFLSGRLESTRGEVSRARRMLRNVKASVNNQQRAVENLAQSSNEKLSELLNLDEGFAVDAHRLSEEVDALTAECRHLSEHCRKVQAVVSAKRDSRRVLAAQFAVASGAEDVANTYQGSPGTTSDRCRMQ
mmetsp:Transcript_47790/g.126527  ORF Transcript_47790/g.126527 Transcript_47790/m.126527 type:complete len:463 (-) Transcript_47790:11-1399(-)